MTVFATEIHEFEHRLSSYRFDAMETLDDQLTNDSIGLLGLLQQHLIEIELQIKRNDKDATLQTAQLIVQEVVDFLIEQLGEDFVRQFQTGICELVESIRAYKQLHDRGFWTRIFNIKSIDPELSDEARTRIGDQLCLLINDMLISIIPDLHNESRRLDWWNSTRIFIEEFQRQW
jgi:hypothetical protein